MIGGAFGPWRSPRTHVLEPLSREKRRVLAVTKRRERLPVIAGFLWPNIILGAAAWYFLSRPPVHLWSAVDAAKATGLRLWQALVAWSPVLALNHWLQGALDSHSPYLGAVSVCMIVLLAKIVTQDAKPPLGRVRYPLPQVIGG